MRAELLIPGGDAGLLSHRDASTVRRVRYREPVASLRMTKASGLRFLLGVGHLLGEGADVVDQVPIFFGLDPRTFGRHVVVSVFDDVEDLAVGAVFEGGGVGEVDNFEFHLGGGSPLPSPSFP